MCSNVLLIATGSRPAFDPFGPFNVDYQGTVNLVTAATAQEYKKVRIPTFFIVTCMMLAWKVPHQCMNAIGKAQSHASPGPRSNSSS